MIPDGKKPYRKGMKGPKPKPYEEKRERLKESKKGKAQTGGRKAFRANFDESTKFLVKCRKGVTDFRKGRGEKRSVQVNEKKPAKGGQHETKKKKSRLGPLRAGHILPREDFRAPYGKKKKTASKVEKKDIFPKKGGNRKDPPKKKKRASENDTVQSVNWMKLPSNSSKGGKELS